MQNSHFKPLLMVLLPFAAMGISLGMVISASLDLTGQRGPEMVEALSGSHRVAQPARLLPVSAPETDSRPGHTSLPATPSEDQ